MENKDHDENEQIGICRRLFSFFVTGMAFDRWKRFIVKRPAQREETGDVPVDGAMVVTAEVGEANKEKEGPVSALPEEINQGTPSEVLPIVSQKESDHKNNEKEKPEKKDEKEKQMKEKEKQMKGMEKQMKEKGMEKQMKEKEKEKQMKEKEKEMKEKEKEMKEKEETKKDKEMKEMKEKEMKGKEKEMKKEEMKVEEEKEKEKEKDQKEKIVPSVVKDVTVQNKNNSKEGALYGSVQAPIKDSKAAPIVNTEETGVSTVGSSGAVARRRTRTRTKKSVSFKDEKDDVIEAQKRKEKEEGVAQKQAMDMNTKFQKFIDDKKQAMRQGSGLGRKPSS